MNHDEVMRLTTRHTFATWRPQKNWTPLHVVDAEGSHFITHDGRRILDFSSQLVCSSLGHKNEAVTNAIIAQARKLAYVSPAFACDVRAELAAKLLEVMPRGLEKFFFSTSGTDANECSFKIARLVTGRHKIVSRYASYHGSTPGSMATTGDARRILNEPHSVLPGHLHAPECNCYRCPLNLRPHDCATACVEYFDYMLSREGNVAAVIVETIVGTNGALVPPDAYLPRLREITKKHGALLIADEVMTGWGRTGAWFAVDHWKVQPDILVTAKGATGATVPLGITAVTREVADHFEENYFPHGHTYEAHPMTLAPAIAAIDESKRLDLVNRARRLGEVLGAKLRALAATHPSVGDVRGRGLLWAVEIVRDRATREPFNVPADKLSFKPLMVEKVAAEMMKKGVYVLPWMSHFVIAPPLIVTEDEIAAGVAALDEALSIADAAL